MLENAGNYTADEILFTNMGDVYKALKRFSKAEESYIQASLMIPHRLYPGYLLAKMYLENGDLSRAKDKAQEILLKRSKTESDASLEMFSEMEKIASGTSCENIDNSMDKTYFSQMYSISNP